MEHERKWAGFWLVIRRLVKHGQAGVLCSRQAEMTSWSLEDYEAGRLTRCSWVPEGAFRALRLDQGDCAVQEVLEARDMEDALRSAAPGATVVLDGHLLLLGSEDELVRLFGLVPNGACLEVAGDLVIMLRTHSFTPLALPARLRVGGSIHFMSSLVFGTVERIVLGEDTEVCGDVLKDRNFVEVVGPPPRRLRVGGSLLLGPTFHSLPDDTAVGTLNLSGCMELREQMWNEPQTIDDFVQRAIGMVNPGGTLVLTGIVSFEAQDGRVRYMPALRDALLGPSSISLEVQPRGVKIDLDLNLGACEGLCDLPPGLRITRLDILVPGSNALIAAVGQHWPAGLSTSNGFQHFAKIAEASGGSLSYWTWEDFTAPDDLKRIGGDLAIRRVPSISSTSGNALAFCEGFEVGGNLHLAHAGVTALPAGLRVGGSILLCCAALTALPAGLEEVNGDLELVSLSALKHFPARLHVRGSLVMREDFQSFTIIPSFPAEIEFPGDLRVDGNFTALGFKTSRSMQLHVGGDITLSGHFTELPDCIQSVNGDLILRGCRGLTKLPEALRKITGNLILDGCTALTALPEGLRVGRRLSLEGCSALSVLPESLEVRSDLILANCAALDARYARDLEAFDRCIAAPAQAASRDLDLTGWSTLAALPDTLCEIGGTLNLTGCAALAALPKRLRRVGGDLVLRNCSALQSLPERLHVAGDVLAFGDTCGLTSLPRGMSVAGKVAITCQTLTTVHDGVEVAGPLLLANCTSLTQLPEDLRVGALDITGCTSLASLPSGLSVKEGSPKLPSVYASGCVSLSTLPSGFHVNAIVLTDCTGLTSLPGDLEVNDIILKGCTALTSLPAGLVVSERLHIEDCSGLSELPAGLRSRNLAIVGCPRVMSIPCSTGVTGDLILDNCERLTSLPSGLHVSCLVLSACPGVKELPVGLAPSSRGDETGSGGGQNRNLDLTIEDCPLVSALPDDLTVVKHLEISNCVAFRGLPDGLHVRCVILNSCPLITDLPISIAESEAVMIVNCVAFSGLPEVPGGWRLHGLVITDCPLFTSLPHSLAVEKASPASLDSFDQDLRLWCGDLTIKDCPRLESLSASNLSVEGSLNLAGCTGLRSLPDAFAIGGDVVLEGCVSLESLPASILDWPLRDDGEPHNIRCGGSGLSQASLDWLREANAPGLRFHVNLAAGVVHQGFASVGEATAFWAKEAEAEAPDIAVRLGDDGDCDTLLRFLSRLRDAKEFAIVETRKALAKRTVAVLELLSGDEDVREELLLRMSDSLDACGDKPVWALNQMSLVVEVAKARGDAEQLRDLGRRVMRLMIVHEHAKRKVDSLQWVDDVCVFLRFEIDLRESLDLPVDATAMIFPSYIEITDEELEAAKSDALAITDKQFESWLAEWPEWQRQERHEVVSKVVWSKLAEVKRRHSLRKRVSRRLSRLMGVTGDKMTDPVSLDGGKSVWSQADLLRHWERTGLDLHNSVVSSEQLLANLRQVVA